MLEHPCIIANISVDFREKPQSSEIPAHNFQERTNTSKIKAPGSNSGTHRSHDEAPEHSGATQGWKKLGCFKTMEAMPRDQQDEEDDMEAYRCLIVEEAPPTTDT